MKNAGGWFFGLFFWLMSALNCDAQAPNYHANPTIAFHEASKSKKDVLLLFCNRAAGNCDEWLRHIQSGDASFLWHFLEVSVIYNDDFDGGVWAARYAVDETPLARLYPHPDGPYKSLTKPESLNHLYSGKNIPVSGNEPNNHAPTANQTILPDTLENVINGGAVQKMLPEKNIENIVSENQETERPPEISKIEVPDLETVSPGFYRIETERMEPMGFAVQIANFNTFAELLHYAERIQHILELEVITEITREKDVVRYKVLLGHFPTREQAADLRTELQRMGIDGFVRKIE